MDAPPVVQAQLGSVAVDALARAAEAWARHDAAAALAAWREVAQVDPGLLPVFPPGSPQALLVDAARLTAVEVPEPPGEEVVIFDPGVDDVDTSTPGTRAALAWVAPPGTYDVVVCKERRPLLIPAVNPVHVRHGGLIASTTLLALASGGVYFLAAQEAEAYFDPATAHADLPDTRAYTNRLVGFSGALAAGGLALGATAVLTW